jgi:hypothetical protein
MSRRGATARAGLPAAVGAAGACLPVGKTAHRGQSRVRSRRRYGAPASPASRAANRGRFLGATEGVGTMLGRRGPAPSPRPRHRDARSDRCGHSYSPVPGFWRTTMGTPLPIPSFTWRRRAWRFGGQRVRGSWGRASGQECYLGADCGGYGAESSRVKRREGRNAGDDCDAFGAARSDQKRPGPQLRRHQPDQIPRERFFRCSAGEVLFFRGLERHHPTGMINRPGARVGIGPFPGDRIGPSPISPRPVSDCLAPP